MKVYRVEDSAGRGPYAYSGVAFPELHADGFQPLGEQPCPWNDGIKDDAFDPGKCMQDHGDPRVCAFSSLEQLAAWFGLVDIERMADEGLQVSVIKVDSADVKFGASQCTIPRNAVRVGRIESTDELVRKLNSQRLLTVAQAVDENHEKRFGFRSGYIIANAKRASCVINEWLNRS